MRASIFRSKAPPHLDIEEVLEVLLLCFEAAADSADPFVLAYAQEVRHQEDRITSYTCWDIGDLDDPPENPLSIFFPPAVLPEGLARLNLCDHFAFLLEKEVSRQMCNFFDAEARWMRFVPKPAFLLSEKSGRPAAIRWHSVLVVTGKNACERVMDGTPQQFGWPRSKWLLSMADFHEEHADKDRLKKAYCTTEEQKKAVKTGLKRKHFWRKVRKAMKELFKDLKWDDLAALPRENHLKTMKKLAEAKFAGISTETEQRRMI
ncbi:hypothetical protein EK21DRAFT_67018 [Setomelanomma holmii]|uniref:Uncharacterized protein n=1 Tax=Setomelanomma holmii TaxID=210430 RepID=A0A9P4H8P1_9PLEO|nr:hypothetical protein EK21DRAFT_67018 [Setomelanomma holmii]